jgi:hypothetical protein
MNILDINDTIDFSNLKLKEPTRLQGGAYFSQLKYYNNDFFINAGKSQTKNGIVETGKRIYCDLLYKEDNDKMASWLLDLEKTIKNLLFEKSSSWFHNEMDLDDIDYFYNSPLRTYKSNNYLLRCFVVNSTKNISKKSLLQIYDESENLKEFKDVEDNDIISIIQIKGIRFTNSSFHLELELKQIMIIDNKPLFSTCMIKKPMNNTIQEQQKEPTLTLIDTNNEEDEEDEEDEADEVDEDEDKDEADEADEDDQQQEKQQIKKEYNNDNQYNLEVSDNINIEISDNENETNKDIRHLGNNKQDLDKNIEDKNEQIISPLKDVSLEEVIINPSELNNNETIQLKKPNEVFYEIYREARKKAKLAKKAAMIAYLEAKNIKNTYMLDDIEDSSDEELDLDDYDLEKDSFETN